MRHSASRKRHGRRKASADIRRRLLLVPAVLLCLVLGLPSGASAYWSAVGTGSGGGSSGQLVAPIAAATRTAGTNTVVISWQLRPGSGDPTSFHIQRSPADLQNWTDICGRESAPIGGTSCSDTITTSGDWIYRVIAHKGTWRATSNVTPSVRSLVGEPAVTIDQAADQTDPSASPIRFTVSFDRAVAGFSSAGVTVTTSSTVTRDQDYAVTVTGSGRIWTVTVSGVSSANGTVSAAVNRHAATDLFGNRNQASTSTDNTVTLDTVAPSPATTAPDLQASSDLGISNTDNITSAAELSFRGSAPTTANGAIARLFRAPALGGAAVEAGRAIVVGSSYTIVDSTAPEGTFSYTVVMTDAAGNKSIASPALSVTVDRTGPVGVADVSHEVIPGLLGLLPTNRVTGSIATDVERVEAYACDLGATVPCTSNQQLGLLANGRFTVEYSRGLLSLGGRMSIWITAIDIAGNKSLAVVEHRITE